MDVAYFPATFSDHKFSSIFVIYVSSRLDFGTVEKSVDSRNWSVVLTEAWLTGGCEWCAVHVYCVAMRVAFAMCDRDADGLISIQEVHDTMTSLGHKVSHKQVKQIVRRVDTDRKYTLSVSVSFSLSVLICVFCVARNKRLSCRWPTQAAREFCTTARTSRPVLACVFSFVLAFFSFSSSILLVGSFDL